MAQWRRFQSMVLMCRFNVHTCTSLFTSTYCTIFLQDLRCKWLNENSLVNWSGFHELPVVRPHPSCAAEVDSISNQDLTRVSLWRDWSIKFCLSTSITISCTYRTSHSFAYRHFGLLHAALTKHHWSPTNQKHRRFPVSSQWIDSEKGRRNICEYTESHFRNNDSQPGG